MSYYFSEDLLIEILKRLPAKSLVKFRCVEKSWYSLIHRPSFKILHSHHQKNTLSDNKYIFYASIFDKMLTLCFDNEEYQGYYLPTGMIQDPTWHAISNGLICLSTMSLRRYNLVGIDYYKNIYIWNPFIRKYITLPHPPRSSVPEIRAEALAAPVKLAFGFVPKFNDYRVVKLIQDYEHNKCFIDVYSLTTNSWRITSDKYLPYHIKAQKKEVFMNGAVFWLAETWDNYADIILCFDTENDSIREMALPLFPHSEEYMNLSLRPYGESQLALFVKKDGSNVIDMFVSETLGHTNHDISWKTKKFTIDVQYGGGGVDFQVQGLLRNKVIILRYLDGKWEWVSYDLGMKDFVSPSFSSSLGLSDDFHSSNSMRVTVTPFMESLFLLNM